MLPELAPYTFATLAVAAFALVIANDRFGAAVSVVYLSGATGAVLVLASMHLGLIALERAVTGPADFNVVVHAILALGFAAVTTFGVPALLLETLRVQR